MGELSPPVLADSPPVHTCTMISKVGAGAECSRIEKLHKEKEKAAGDNSIRRRKRRRRQQATTA